MNELEIAWRDNDTIFHRQLEYNLKEISSIENYPAHWHIFMDFVNASNPKSILDVGCGCGTYYELCRKHFDLEYTGIDYSDHAIKLAKEHWGHDGFFVKDYKDLTPDYIQGFDLIHSGAMFDVLPNGDDALEYVMSLRPKSLLIGRMKITEEESYYNKYGAYDCIETCEFYHNREKFLGLCKQYGYGVTNIEGNFYLGKLK